MVTKQGGGVSTQTLDKSQLLHIYEQMKTIREFEERASKEFASGKLPGFVHLYAGEEAVAVGVCAHLTDDDYITSHHRWVVDSPSRMEQGSPRSTTGKARWRCVSLAMAPVTRVPSTRG